MPSPTHLVGLEIIVQRKLQFAQVLWLLLLLAFTFSFGQARLCIVIILGELRVGREGLKGEGSSHPSQRQTDSEPLSGELCYGESPGFGLYCLQGTRQTLETSMRWESDSLGTPRQTPSPTLGRHDISPLWGQALCHRPDSFLKQGESLCFKPYQSFAQIYPTWARHTRIAVQAARSRASPEKQKEKGAI